MHITRYSLGHALLWSCTRLVMPTYMCSMLVRAPLWKPWLLLHHVYIRAASWLCYVQLYYGYFMLYCGCCYGCYVGQERGYVYGHFASQERINVSALPTDPWVFQPLSSSFAYPGFNKQCRHFEQQGNWPHEKDQQYASLPINVENSY